MKPKYSGNTTNLLINLALLALFVILGTLSFQADSAPTTSGSAAQIESNL